MLDIMKAAAAGRMDGGGVLRWERDRCMFCGCCVPRCEAGALLVRETLFELERARCSACGACAGWCPTGALSIGPGGRSGEECDGAGHGRMEPPFGGGGGDGRGALP